MSEEWIHKYKPKSLDDMVLNPATRKELEKLSRNNKSFMLTGASGCGKNCFLDILLSESETDFLWLDPSKQAVKYIRENVEKYCSSVFNYTGKNFVVFNESDNLRIDSQKMLNEIIDKYDTVTRFAFITNKLDRMTDSLLSRLVTVKFRNPVEGDVFKYLDNILRSEGHELNPQTTKIIKRCISENKSWIDFRKILNDLENNLK
jgi:DNA polymerase III delta prime subunit